jgi:hypothetical protein
VPLDQLAAILGVSALPALLALAIPTRRTLRSRPSRQSDGGAARDGDVDGLGVEGARRLAGAVVT